MEPTIDKAVRKFVKRAKKIAAADTAGKLLRKVVNISIEMLRDEHTSPDYLGEYASNPASPCAIDRQKLGDASRNSYRYFNPSPTLDLRREELHNTRYSKHAAYTAARDGVKRDYERYEKFNEGDWHFIGLRAKAEVQVSLNGGKDWICQSIESPGLWAIESDSSLDYLQEVGIEELNQLRDILTCYGFSVLEMNDVFNVKAKIDAILDGTFRK